jgi:ribonuclease BN (tRNA processing enzyme)
MHADHAESLTSVAKAYAVYSPQKETDIFFAEEAAIEPYKAWQRALHLTPDTERVRLRVTMPGVIYENYGIKVSAIRTEHISKEIPTYAYIFESDEGKRVLFTGDLSNDFRDFPKVAKEEPFDVVVSELTHFSVDKAQPILREVKTKLMIFSHVSAWNISLLEKNNITFDFPHIVATDGFEYYVV